MWLKSLIGRHTVRRLMVTSEKATGPPGNVSDKFEKCVLCGRITAVRSQTPITQRPYYIEGCGQLCESCYTQMYITSEKAIAEHSHVSLVEACAIVIGCQYISDLRFLNDAQRRCLTDYLASVEIAECDAFEWNDALRYLTDAPPPKTSEGAKQQLIELLKHPNTMRASII